MDIQQIYEFCQKKNISIPKLITIPEQDSWVYSDGKSRVCDAFWVSLLKEGGAIPTAVANSIQATEFTPADAYEVQLFQQSWNRPQPCLVDDLPYCQLFGDYLLELPGYNTISLYANMNENCPSVPPEYYRPAKC